MKTQNILLSEITTGKNVRLESRYFVGELVQAIAQDGLQEPLRVRQTAKGFEVIAGHRRLKAIKAFKEAGSVTFTGETEDGKPREPRTFNYEDRFPKDEVPCFVVKATDKEALYLKIDDGAKHIANNPYELQTAASMLFDAGCTEAEVAVRLNHIMDGSALMKGGVRKKVEALRSKGDHDAADKEVASYRRGMVQGLKNVWRLPEIVDAAFYLKYAGEKPKGFEDKDLPGITYNDAKTLYAALLKDKEANPKTGKANPGPLFWEAWAKILERDAKRSSDPEPRDKAMSGSAMKDEAKDTWNSETFRDLCRRHAGAGYDLGLLKAMDELCLAIESLRAVGHPLVDGILNAYDEVKLSAPRVE